MSAPDYQADRTPAQRAREIVMRYPDKTGRVINVLNDIQDEYRYLPEEALREVSKLCEVPYEQLLNTASFFAELSTEPIGRHLVEICDGTACHTRGASQLAEVLAERLGIAVGGTTSDGAVTLRLVHCVGACSVAPVVVVDKTAYGRVRISDVGTLAEAAYADKDQDDCHG